jgi:hypothetical protein
MDDRYWNALTKGIGYLGKYFDITKLSILFSNINVYYICRWFLDIKEIRKFYIFVTPIEYLIFLAFWKYNIFFLGILIYLANYKESNI